MGTIVLLHKKSNIRQSWAPRKIPGFYVRPAFLHFRCYRVWGPETNTERIIDTVVWFPTTCIIPIASPATLIDVATRDLIIALLSTQRSSLLFPLSSSLRHELI